MRAIRRFSGSSSFWVGALFTLLLSLSVYLSLYFIHVSEESTLIGETRAALYSESDLLKLVYKNRGLDALKNTIESKVVDSNRHFLYALKNSQELIIAGDLDSWPRLQGSVSFNDLQTFSYSPVSPNQKKVLPGEHRYLSWTGMLNKEATLLVARDVETLQVMQQQSKVVGWVMLLIVIVVSLASFTIGYFVFNRINRMAAKAGDIMSTGNLATRLPIDSSWDDLSKLAVVLNQMLDEIENLVGGVRSVSDNIAHDLRTPLTRLRAHLDGISDPKARHELIAEVDNILSIFNGLLRITQIESEKQKQRFAHVNLSLVIDDVVDLYYPVAEQKGINIVVESCPCKIWGDKDMLFQAFANVLDNGIKFSPPGAILRVSVKPFKKEIEVAITNSGSAVPEDAMDKLTRRFYRVDESRSTVGNGLGLALVSAVIKLHAGELVFENIKLDHQVPGFRCICRFKVKST